MHSEVRQEKPGLCSECGMALLLESEEKVDETKEEHDKHAGHSTSMFLGKFWVSLLLSIPVVLYSDIFKELFEWQAPVFARSSYIPLVFASIVFFYGGWIFLIVALPLAAGVLVGQGILLQPAVAAIFMSFSTVIVAVNALLLRRAKID